jgi:hypothetical protein
VADGSHTPAGSTQAGCAAFYTPPKFSLGTSVRPAQILGAHIPGAHIPGAHIHRAQTPAAQLSPALVSSQQVARVRNNHNREASHRALP